MILDNISNCEFYYGVHKNFQAAFDFIKKATEENLPKGKYEIDGKELYASVQEYDSKTYEDAKNEGHKNYIDIQYIVSGIEVIESIDIAKINPINEYNPEKDVMHYEKSDKAAKCVLEAGDYMILYPNDIHMPGVAFEGKSVPVKKIVVKVKL